MCTFKHTLISLAFSAAAIASTIQPTPTTSTTCVLDNAPVTCGTFYSPLTYGPDRIGADNLATASGFDTTDGLTLNLTAQAITYIPYAQRESGYADSFVGYDFWASTDGVERAGFATFSIYTDGDHGSTAGVLPVGVIAGLGGCGGIYCQSRGTLVPFELGTAFEIRASVHAYSGTDFTGAGGISQIRLQLFEANGTEVPISDPPAPVSSVPEPGSAGLAMVGMVALIALRRR